MKGSPLGVGTDIGGCGVPRYFIDESKFTIVIADRCAYQVRSVDYTRYDHPTRGCHITEQSIH
jgi:hypothetical protein